jgi:protein tyrosine/serine phosphatase
LFSALADKDNYPIYVHCTNGRDSTGTLMYLLEALLGVDDETLYKEYALSAFTDKYLETEKFETFVSEIDSMRGFSTKQKVENWLLSIGVSQSEINNIREILLED